MTGAYQQQIGGVLPGSTGWLVLAAACGGVHAAFSGLWAAGSDLLLSTVGDVADQISAMGPVRQAALLGSIALAKAGLVLGLCLDAWGLLGADGLRRLVRGGEVLAGGGLLVYGLVSMAASGAGLASEVGRAQPDPARLTALWGHLGIWDLLFALWGVGTIGYLVSTGRPAVS